VASTVQALGDFPVGWFADEDRKKRERACSGCQGFTVHHTCGLKPNALVDQRREDAARDLYNHHAANHPTIHCNRFPAWSEMGDGDRDVWRNKVVCADLVDHCTGRDQPDPQPQAQPDARPPASVDDVQAVLDAVIYDHGMTTAGKVEAITAMIAQEVTRAMTKWPPNTDSPHHHMGVLREEVDEMWDEVKADNIRLAREECLQAAAMCIRFILEADLAPSRRRPRETPKPRPYCPGCGAHPPYHHNGCLYVWTGETTATGARAVIPAAPLPDTEDNRRAGRMADNAHASGYLASDQH
jgi:hypothetical protein